MAELTCFPYTPELVTFRTDSSVVHRENPDLVEIYFLMFQFLLLELG